MQTRPTKLGIIGLGAIAQIAHIPALKTMPDRFEVRHVCDLSAELATSIASQFDSSCRSSSDAGVLLDDPRIDAVVILTPGAHGPEVLRALDAGKHVFAEKPLCLTLGEVDRIEESARAANRCVQVGYMKSHEPAVVRARGVALERLGTPLLVRSTVLHPPESATQRHVRILTASNVDRTLIRSSKAHEAGMTAQAIGEQPPFLEWFYREVALGSLIHQVSTVRSIMGFAPWFETAHVWPAPALDQFPEEPPSLVAIGRLDSNIVFELTWLWVTDSFEYREDLTIYGTAGSARIELPPPYRRDQTATLTVSIPGESSDSVEVSNGGAVSAFRRQLEFFRSSILQPDHTGLDLGGVREDLYSLQCLSAEVGGALGFGIGGEALANRKDREP